jgi:hypothetical protein
MRIRSRIPNNKKYFHTAKKYDKRDSNSLKNKRQLAQIQKDDHQKEHIKLWNYRKKNNK